MESWAYNGFLVKPKRCESNNFPISIFPQHNKIIVKYPEFFQDAVSLAEAYERFGEPEFEVQKDYSE